MLARIAKSTSLSTMSATLRSAGRSWVNAPRMWGIRLGADTRMFLMGSRSGIRGLQNQRPHAISGKPASTLRIEQMNMPGRQAERHALARLDCRALACRHAPRAATYFPVQMRFGTSRLNHLDFHRHAIRRRQRFDMLGPNAKR